MPPGTMSCPGVLTLSWLVAQIRFEPASSVRRSCGCRKRSNVRITSDRLTLPGAAVCCATVQ
jgi:hypothetical protein